MLNYGKYIDCPMDVEEGATGVKRLCRLVLSVFLICVLLYGGTIEAAGLNTPISAHFDNFYVEDAITFVADGAGMSWLTCGDFKGTISMSFDNLQSAKALDRIAREKKLVWHASRGMIVVRSAAKVGIDARVSYEATKVPLGAMLQAMADALELKLVIRGKLTGEVTEEFSGTMKEAIDTFATRYRFKWSNSSKVIKVYPLT
jgi:hypothetical protein